MISFRATSAFAATKKGQGMQLGRQLQTLSGSSGVRYRIVDGVLLKASKMGGHVNVLALEPEGVLAAFAQQFGVPPETYGSVPDSQLTRVDYVAPPATTIKAPSAPPTDEPYANRGVVGTYTYTPAEGANMHLLGEAPPVGATLYWFDRGAMWEGEAGVYCASHLSTVRQTNVVRITNEPKWLRVEYKSAGLNDGRRGVMVSEAYLQALAPGYVLFIDERSTSNVPPHSHGCEDGDNVVVSFQMQQRRAPGLGPDNPSYISAQLVMCVDLKTGALVWSQLFEFDVASHPMFTLTPVPTTSTPSLDTRDVTPTLSVGHPRVERVVRPDGAVKFFVGFTVRCARGYLYQPEEPLGQDLYFTRWFTAVCVLEVDPVLVVDRYYGVDCWCGATSPAVTDFSLDPVLGTRVVESLDLLGGLPVYWTEVYERLPFDETDFSYVFSRPVSAPDYQRLFVGATQVGTAGASGVAGAEVFNLVQRPNFVVVYQPRGHTKTADDTLATVWGRFAPGFPNVVALVRGVGAAILDPAGGPGVQGLTLTCPQREVRDEEGNVVVQPILIAAAPAGGTVAGQPTAVLHIRQGGADWYTVPVVGYGVGGVAYLGNPLRTARYGHMFEGTG